MLTIFFFLLQLSLAFTKDHLPPVSGKNSFESIYLDKE